MSDHPHAHTSDHGHHPEHGRQPEHGHEPLRPHGHGHGHVHLGEEEWARLAEQAEHEGEAYAEFVTDTIAWVDRERAASGAGPVGRILDVGSGPGVAATMWAERHPDAEVVAIDGSAAMLARAAARARRFGLEHRMRTHHAELPGGLASFAKTADVVWMSMALHHVGDEVAALREVAACLAPGGLLAVAEFGDPTALLPADVGVGRPGLAERVASASADWFAAMRAGLPGSAPSASVADMMRAAGLEVVGERHRAIRVEAPLPPPMRAVVQGALRRVREQLAGRLDTDDLAALDVLADPSDPRRLADHPHAFAEASRLIVLARPAGHVSTT